MFEMYNEGNIDIRLVASKTRVVPLKEQTTPRLELLGTAISAQLMDTVFSILKFKAEQYY